MPGKSKAKGGEKGTCVKIWVAGSPSPEALRQAYKILARSLIKEMGEQCGQQSTPG